LKPLSKFYVQVQLTFNLDMDAENLQDAILKAGDIVQGEIGNYPLLGIPAIDIDAVEDYEMWGV
jgi:hypothetical protein